MKTQIYSTFIGWRLPWTVLRALHILCFGVLHRTIPYDHDQDQDLQWVDFSCERDLERERARLGSKYFPSETTAKTCLVRDIWKKLRTNVLRIDWKRVPVVIIVSHSVTQLHDEGIRKGYQLCIASKFLTLLHGNKNQIHDSFWLRYWRWLLSYYYLRQSRSGRL